jgi:hypothetical protein
LPAEVRKGARHVYRLWLENPKHQELAEFREWFHAFEQDEWDRQIARDAESGKLDKFAEEAIADYKTGRVKEL